MTYHLLEAARAAICTDHGETLDRYDLARAVGYIIDHLEAQQTGAVLCHECGRRPAGCCGTCPPVLGGGYDCDCASDPRCDANHADRYDSDGDRWGWCDPCGGFRLGWCHAQHHRGAGLDAASVDKCYGPLTFAPRGAEPPATAPQPDPNTTEALRSTAS